MNLRLKLAILQRFSSQGNFAQAAGMGDVIVSRIVRERILPTPQQRKKIAEVLEEPEDKLFPLPKDPKRSEA